TSFHFAHPRCTSRIISPPPRSGSVASKSSCFPYKTPIPVGPSILCPLNARKSASRLCTSMGMCGAAWAASTTQMAPTSCALFASAFVLAGGLFPQLVDRPMDVRVVARIEVRRRVDDLLRLLGCRSAVQVDESLVPDRALQDREVRLDGRHVQQDLRGFRHVVPPCHDRLNT